MMSIIKNLNSENDKTKAPTLTQKFIVITFRRNYGDNWIYGWFSNFPGETLPHFAG